MPVVMDIEQFVAFSKCLEVFVYDDSRIIVWQSHNKYDMFPEQTNGDFNARGTVVRGIKNNAMHIKVLDKNPIVNYILQSW